MGSVDDFARDCRDAGRQTRRLPAELRKALASEVQPRVAVPLAARVAAAQAGPWGAHLRAATKARKFADPTIVIGGRRKVASGGASARQLVYGATFGAKGIRSQRVTRRTRSGRETSYQLRVTAQFVGKGRDNIFPTIRRDLPWVLDQFAGIVDDVLEGVTNG